jgi:hypothetical protein
MEFICGSSRRLPLATHALPGRPARRALPRNPREHGANMLDAILIAAGVGFFLLSILYAVACDRL